MGQFREFADLDDQARQDVFDKFVRRQKVSRNCAFVQPTEPDGLAMYRRRFGIGKEKRVDRTMAHQGNEKGEIVIDEIGKTAVRLVLVGRRRSALEKMTVTLRARM